MSTSFKLPAELSIYTAQATRDALQEWLRALGANGAPIDIQGEAVEEIDGAGLQLLCALQRTLEGQGRPWTLTNPSAALSEVAATMGWSMKGDPA